MRQIKFLIIVFSLISCQRHKYSFDSYISKSDSCYHINEFNKAGLYADTAFMIKTGSKDEYYNSACCWSLANNDSKSLDYLDKAINSGYINLNWLNQDKDLLRLHSKKGWSKLIDKINKNIAIYESKLDKPLKKELETILIDDQKYRKLIDSIESKFGRKSKEMSELWKKMSEMDSIDLIKVIFIIEKKGWPGINIVGEDANQAVWLVIQHADLKTQEKYLPLLKESVSKNESSGGELALLEDRIQLGNHKPQIYGSQVIIDSITGQRKFADIYDEANVNKRRAKVRLGKIEDYAKFFGIEYKISKK